MLLLVSTDMYVLTFLLLFPILFVWVLVLMSLISQFRSYIWIGMTIMEENQLLLTSPRYLVVQFLHVFGDEFIWINYSSSYSILCYCSCGRSLGEMSSLHHIWVSAETIMSTWCQRFLSFWITFVMLLLIEVLFCYLSLFFLFSFVFSTGSS